MREPGREKIRANRIHHKCLLVCGTDEPFALTDYTADFGLKVQTSGYPVDDTLGKHQIRCFFHHSSSVVYIYDHRTQGLNAVPVACAELHWSYRTVNTSPFKSVEPEVLRT